MTNNEINQRVEAIFKEVFPEIKEQTFDFTKNQDQFDNWDSFSHMDIVSKVEEKFGINLEIEEVVELSTPERFVEIIKKKKEV